MLAHASAPGGRSETVMADATTFKVLIASENVSMRMGGEASLGYYYAKLLSARGVEVWIVCHDRVREELSASLPPVLLTRVRFVKDSLFQRVLYRCTSKIFPDRVNQLLVGQLLLASTQARSRRLVRSLVSREGINVVFQPEPIAPKSLSFMYDVGAPVVIGPMCGGLDFPPAFRAMDGRATRAAVALGRALAQLLHRVVPGKLHASALIVADCCTAKALPRGVRGKIYEVPESGVDLDLWKPIVRKAKANDDARPVRFVYSGRFVDWKGLPFLSEAFSSVVRRQSAVLELIGDGVERPAIEALIDRLRLRPHLVLHGWLSRKQSAAIVRECDVFVMPSLRECGGTAILEAMAQGLPVIVARWAGPCRYVDDGSGVRVDVSTRDGFVSGLADAMVRLGASPELRAALGRGGIRRARENYYDWDSKADRVLEILWECRSSALSKEPATSARLPIRSL